MSKSLATILGVIILGFAGLAVFYPKEPEAPKIGQQHEDEGRQHLQSIDQEHAPYKTDPPTSGPHFVQAAPWGVSGTEIPDEQVVHNLEHGGVVITYRPDLPEEKVNELRTIATNLTVNDEQQNKKGFKVILAPRAKNNNPIELASWLWSYSLNDLEQGQIQQFYRDHLNNAPEANAT
jgi:hypothetical protein